MVMVVTLAVVMSMLKMQYTHKKITLVVLHFDIIAPKLFKDQFTEHYT